MLPEMNFGSEIEGWSEIDKVWANVNQTGVSEDFENDANRECSDPKFDDPHPVA